MAEIEQASLKSEQISDKSSSPALPDDLSLDEHTAYHILTREGKVSTQTGVEIVQLNIRELLTRCTVLHMLVMTQTSFLFRGKCTIIKPHM